MTVEESYEVAKSGEWDRVLTSMSRDPALAAACSRYVKPRSRWTFMHQAAHFGHELGVRALVGLGATLDVASQEGESPIDVAEGRGHRGLAQIMRDAVQGELWRPPASSDVRASSSAWAEAEPRRTQLGLSVAYGGGTVQIPPGSRYFVDSFERILVGWHGTFNPPSDMGGYPCIDATTMTRRLAVEIPDAE